MNNDKYMLRCLELARLGEYYVSPNPMVGAVLVRDCDGYILGEGWHQRYGEAHAEVNCFRDAEQKNPTIISYADCTLYVSLEPCSHYGKTPPCAELIIRKAVGRVVVGILDPNPLVAGKGVEMLRKSGIEVVVGVLESSCRALNKRFICLHEQQRPYIILKWAQTADGFIDYNRELPSDTTHGTAPKQALAISTASTKKIVHRMRAENMSIMVGTRTVLLDNPRLLNTHWEGMHPIRVTMDRHGVIPADSRIFSTDSETIVYRDCTDWAFILSDLGKRKIHSVLVEGGKCLLECILAEGTWDEIHVEIAPELSIGAGVPAPQIALPSEYELIDGHKLYVITKII